MPERSGKQFPLNLRTDEMSWWSILSSRRSRILGFTVVLILAGVGCYQGGMDLWFTPDQQGRMHFAEGEFGKAAETYRDPMWQGVAFYRDGEFEDAAQAFSRRDTADGQYNQGNAWLMKGEYEKAVGCFDKALVKRPNWQDAIDNKSLAKARAALLSQEGGDMGDQRLGADKIVFDKKNKNEGQDTDVDGGEALSDKEVQAMWLRRVQTRPADFLKSKFAFQQAATEGVSE